jgi:predicted XRE-type DNA-binding protein
MAKHNNTQNYLEANTPEGLAKLLGLPPAAGVEIKLRSDLNDKIIETVKGKGLTHAQVATLSKTSRTRVTAIINRNTKDISTDLMLRVLSSLGIRATITFKKAS